MAVILLCEPMGESRVLNFFGFLVIAIKVWTFYSLVVGERRQIAAPSSGIKEASLSCWLTRTFDGGSSKAKPLAAMSKVILRFSLRAL